MSAQQPTIGRIVLYKLARYDADQINQHRADFRAFVRNLPPGDRPGPGEPGATGHQAHVGNHVAAGEVYPAVVVRSFGGTTVNLQVLLDGADTYWATSRQEGDEQCQWTWPSE